MIAESLKPDKSHQEFKGALFILLMEKYGFFYSWKHASILFPAMVQAQHSDKASIVDLLKDLSIKCNRSDSDFALFSLPVKPAVMSIDVLNDLGAACVDNFMEESNFDVENQDFLALESKLLDLVQDGNSLHWRHYQMAVGMLLTMMVSDHQPQERLINFWLDSFLHDDVAIRSMAFQVIISHGLDLSKPETLPKLFSLNDIT